jgi:hypothetical protein
LYSVKPNGLGKDKRFPLYVVKGACIMVAPRNIPAQLSEVMELTEWMQTCPFIDRYAIFTTRVDDSPWWWPAGWSKDMNLWNNGVLTNVGQYYLQRDTI